MRFRIRSNHTVFAVFSIGQAGRTCLVIQTCVVYPDHHAVHSQEEPQQEEETGGHHSLKEANIIFHTAARDGANREDESDETHDFHIDHRHAVIVQLVLEQQHVLEELDLFSRSQLLHVDALGGGRHLFTSAVGQSERSALGWRKC